MLWCRRGFAIQEEGSAGIPTDPGETAAMSGQVPKTLSHKQGNTVNASSQQSRRKGGRAVTIEEYNAELRKHGFTVLNKIRAGETVNFILQGRERDEVATIMAPESQTSEQRAETMAAFLRRYVL